MPATEVSPALRRRLSDDARELLRSAFGIQSDARGATSSLATSRSFTPASSPTRFSVKHLTFAERLQNFRGLIRLELPDLGDAASACVHLRIAVSGMSYLLRYQVDSIDAEVSVLNKAGSITSWISTADGQHTQLRTFLQASPSPLDECARITSLVDILEFLDLFDVFRASLSAQSVLSPRRTRDGSGFKRETLRATSDKNAYVFVFDKTDGHPVMATQTVRANLLESSISSGGQPKKLRMVVEDYVRFEDDAQLEPPAGIKSDVELMVDTAMACFSQWDAASQQRVMRVFDVTDRDNDGCVSGADVYEQLVAAGQSELQSTTIVIEMSRLLCDSADPAEEFKFYKFAGFWITMLADGFRVSDPANARSVCASFERLFLGTDAVDLGDDLGGDFDAA
ncbi:hypothetical protein PybrP1_007737 [[Pythium] brassicae (nom. inval.)]|nr:hypothetical protein PybrP1_007737 [[Pythium] brassicae (nom. inval.)]